jgi:hypothetical protein
LTDYPHYAKKQSRAIVQCASRMTGIQAQENQRAIPCTGGIIQSGIPFRSTVASNRCGTRHKLLRSKFLIMHM